MAMESSHGGKINLNRASVDELAKIPGIDEDLARAIVNYREQHGRIKDVDELDGIGMISGDRMEYIRNNTTL